MMSTTPPDPFAESEPTLAPDANSPIGQETAGEQAQAKRAVSAVRANLLFVVSVLGFLIGLSTVIFAEALHWELVGYVLGVLVPISTVALYRRQAERVAASRGRVTGRRERLTTTMLMLLGLGISVALAAGIAGHFA